MGNQALEYDFIIVGAGSAGCAVAYQLARLGRFSVLLLEQGPPDRSPMIRMPKGFGALLFKETYVGRYPATNHTREKTDEVWLRGKTLGGSSSVNGMLWMRPQEAGFGAMTRVGAPHWAWPAMQVHFDLLDGGGDGKGTFEVGPNRSNYPITEAFIDAAGAHGLPRLTHLPEIGREGAACLQYNINAQGRRVSAAHALLGAVRDRAQLTVSTGARVERIAFAGQRATGVIGRRNGEAFELRARREVILSAGALESPLILQRSGIGAPSLLDEFGIAPVVDSPRVGANLREHLLLGVNYHVKDWINSENRQYGGARLAANLLRYLWSGTGPMAQGPSHAAAFLRSGVRGDDGADIMLMFNPFARRKDSFSTTPGISFAAYAVHPQSEGFIRIRSRDPDAAPELCPSYLQSEQDRRVSIAALRKLREIVEHEPLAGLLRGEMEDSAWAHSDEEILELYQRKGLPGFHAVGSCAMGSSAEDSVVDARTRVHGVEGVRVVDGSIMPEMLAGITNATVMALGLHGAQLIAEEHA